MRFLATLMKLKTVVLKMTSTVATKETVEKVVVVHQKSHRTGTTSALAQLMETPQEKRY